MKKLKWKCHHCSTAVEEATNERQKEHLRTCLSFLKWLKEPVNNDRL